MSSLYLIRHGKTQANLDHVYCGSTDIPLSQTGRQELKTLHYDIHPDVVLTSGMKRTEETLAILFGPVEHRAEPELREIDFGDFEMKGYEELKERADYQTWITGDNEANVPPNGESGNQMTDRVLKAIRPLLDSDQSTLVVTHGGVIAAIMAELFPEEGKYRYQWQPVPGHGYAIQDGHYRPIP